MRKEIRFIEHIYAVLFEWTNYETLSQRYIFQCLNSSKSDSHNDDTAFSLIWTVKSDWSGDSRGIPWKCRVIPRLLIGQLGGTPSADQWENASIFTSPDDSDVNHGSKHKEDRADLKLRHKVCLLVSESVKWESGSVCSEQSVVCPYLEQHVGDGEGLPVGERWVCERGAEVRRGSGRFLQLRVSEQENRRSVQQPEEQQLQHVLQRSVSTWQTLITFYLVYTRQLLRLTRRIYLEKVNYRLQCRNLKLKPVNRVKLGQSDALNRS